MKSARRTMSLCVHIVISLPVALATILVATSISPAAGATSYCSDLDRVARWETLSRNHPKDYGIQLLDALRIGLCRKVEQGTLSHLEMLEIFWASRSELLAEGVSQRMEDFLDQEAYREHKRELLEERVERLHQKHQSHLRHYEDLVAQIGALNGEIRDAQEKYQRRCEKPQEVATRRCERVREDIEELREEVRDINEEADSVRDRERLAYRRYMDAREELK